MFFFFFFKEGETECENEEDPDPFDPNIFEITSQMKFPSTSTKTQPFKSTADKRNTSRDFLPESSQSDPGSSAAMSTTVEKDNIGDGIQLYVLVKMNFKMVHVHVIQSKQF